MFKNYGFRVMNTYRNFILLWQGFLVSTLGAVIYSILGVLWLTGNAYSASLVGLFLLTGGAAKAVFTPFAGVVADRFNRRNIIVISGIVSGFFLLGLFSLIFFWVVPIDTC